MVLSDENILKFQTLYKSEFGMEISKEDARKKGTKLLQLISIVYKPNISENKNYNETQNK
jgi:hypothetical protein